MQLFFQIVSVVLHVFHNVLLIATGGDEDLADGGMIVAPFLLVGAVVYWIKSKIEQRKLSKKTELD